jgi:PAS domain S-box-containing protein
MRMQDLLAPEYRPLFDEYLGIIQEQQTASGLTTLLTKGGKRTIWEYHNVLRKDSGTPVIFGFARDVTDTRHAERKLRRLAELNRAITANAREGIIVLDRQLRYVTWNRSVEKISGVLADKVLGRHVLDVLPFLKEQGVYDLLQKALNGKSVEAVDLPVTPANTGKTTWFSTNMSPFRGAQGQIIGVIVTLYDITERKLAEEELRQNHRSASLLWSVAHTINNSGSLTQVLQSAVDGIALGFGCDVALCFLEKEGKLPLAAINRTMASFRDAPVHRIGECLCGLALEQGTPIYSSDIGLDPRCTWAECKNAGLHSFAALPLNTVTGTRGVLGLGSATPRDFSKDAHLLETLAAEVSLMMNNAVLLHEASQRASELEREIADRKRTQEALRESEERYRKVVELAGEGIWMYDADTKVTWINDQMTQMLGYPREEILGVPALHFIAPESMDLVRTKIERRKQGLSDQYEIKFRHKNGTSVWGSINATASRDSAGNFIGGIGMVRDITDRKHAEEEIFNSRQMLQAVLDNIPQRVFYKDRDLKYIACNKPFALDSGRNSPDELLGKTDYEMDWAANADLYRADDRSVMESGKPKIRYEEPQNKPDGTQAWLVTSKVPMFDRNGQVIGILGTYEDITDRKRAEEALRRSETQLRSFVANAPYAITRASVKGDHFLEVNPAAITMLGYNSRAEVMALKLSELYVDPVGRDAFLSELMESPFSTDFEQNWKRKDGRPLTVRGSAWIVHDAVHNEDVLEGIFDDITERRLLEEQFLQAQKMEAVGRLAGGVAHDFNNLLEVILGYADMLAEGEKDPAHQRKLDAISAAARRAAGLTGQLLAFSRKQVLEFKLLSLNTVVSDTDSMLRRLIGEDIRLRLRLQPDLGLAKADPAQIGQVIMNLAVNARDAMPNGGELRIETANITVDDSSALPSSIPPPGSFVMLAVSDTGVGMDTGTQAHIFDPFFTTKPAGKGTGLGLASVYGIVKQSGGCIRVVSEVGRGARFEIYLPKAEGTADSLKPQKRTTEKLGGNETILLAEDSAALRVFLCESLEKLGYKVLPTRDGAEALHFAEHEPNPIHLLITDVVMPGLSGPDLVKRMKSIRPDIKVLLMSGYTDDHVGRNPDFDPQTFLQKPFEMDDLAQKIRTALNSNVKKLR